jgi:pimeloyl-ACP methyl ester carboxylesterase
MGDLAVRGAHRAGAVGLALLAELGLLACMPAEWGANAILHPSRRALAKGLALPHIDLEIRTEGIVLKGWLVRAQGERRGLIVYLHGIADNRESGVGFAERFVPKGYDVLLYDARAHGESGGENCTYGYFEKRDLLRALDAVGAREAVVFGSSLGAAVALQAAPLDARIRAVIAQSPFSDLGTIIRERAPWIATESEIQEAIGIAEARGRFKVSEVSPQKAALEIRVPVLLIHGDADRKTRPEHSLRIHAALRGPKTLLLVPGAGHDDVLQREEPWRAIEAFVAAAAGS